MLFTFGSGYGRYCASLLVLGSLDDQHGGVTAIIENHVGLFVAPIEGAGGAPPVFFQRFAFPREHGNPLWAIGGSGADRDRGGSVVLGGVNIAGCPPHLSAEGGEGFNQNRGLHGHM